jgi:predicted GIY-YIG superfamily endonuclease
MSIKSPQMVFPGCFAVASAWDSDVRNLIARESQLKEWSRVNKIRLINRLRRAPLEMT